MVPLLLAVLALQGPVVGLEHAEALLEGPEARPIQALVQLHRLEALPYPDSLRSRRAYLYGKAAIMVAELLTRKAYEDLTAFGRTLPGPDEYRAYPRLARLRSATGLSLEWDDSAHRYRYDGEAFRQVLAIEPHGSWADRAAWELVRLAGSWGRWGADADRAEGDLELVERFLETYPRSSLQRRARLAKARIHRALAEIYSLGTERDLGQSRRHRETALALFRALRDFPGPVGEEAAGMAEEMEQGIRFYLVRSRP